MAAAGGRIRAYAKGGKVKQKLATGGIAGSGIGAQAGGRYAFGVPSMGLDQPVAQQLWIYLSSVVGGDLGYSFISRAPVLEVILARLPATLLLLLVGVATRWVALATLPILLGAAWVHLPNGWVFSAKGGGWDGPFVSNPLWVEANAAALRKLMFWALTQGQAGKYTAKLYFAPIPKVVLVAAEKTLQTVAS